MHFGFRDVFVVGGFLRWSDAHSTFRSLFVYVQSAWWLSALPRRTYQDISACLARWR